MTRTLDMHYPLVHQSNQRPYHVLHGFVQDLEQELSLRIPLTQFHGEIYLSKEERPARPLPDRELPDRYWLLVAGGNHDFTAKWWDPARYQAVVDHFGGRIRFLRCGGPAIGIRN